MHTLINNTYRISDCIYKGKSQDLYSVEKIYGKNEGKLFVAKYIKISKNEISVQQLSKYKKILEKIKFDQTKHLVRLEEYHIQKPDEINDDFQITLIMEACDGGSLADRINLRIENGELVNDLLSGVENKKILLQVCKGLIEYEKQMAFLGNGKNIFHGNLTPHNILFDDENTIKLADFQILKIHPNSMNSNQKDGAHYSNLWKSPEQLQKNTEVGPLTDVWSIGIILYQLLRGQHPFPGSSIDELMNNIVSDNQNRRKVEYIPEIIENIIDNCLEKNIQNRYQSIHSLADKIEKIEFMKRCANGHLREYYESVCKEPECGSGFSPSDSSVAWDSIDSWIRYQRNFAPLTLDINEEKTCLLELYPSSFPNLRELGREEKIVKFYFKPCEKPLKIRLLQPPKFESKVGVAEIAWEPTKELEEINYDLILIESEAIIEKIDAELEEADGAVIEARSNEINKKLKPGDTLSIILKLDLKKIQVGEYYNIIIKLGLKNREKPVLLDKSRIKNFQLKVSNPPQLKVLPEDDILVEVYKGTDQVSGELEIANVGGDILTITQIACEFNSDEVYLSADPIITFDEVATPLSFREKTPPQRINYTIFPDNITDDIIKVRLKICYYYTSEQGVKSNIDLRDIIIEVINPEQGWLMAIDFGTTSSYWIAYLKGFSNEKDRVELYHEGNEEEFIHSSIAYYEGYKRVTIGTYAFDLYTHGYKNAFRSFKRKIGSKSTYRVITHDKMQKLFAENLTCDYLTELIKDARQILGYEFKNFIFTHPSKFSLPKLKAFKKVIEDAGIKNYTFIDEATAGALDYISNTPGYYKLLVYDFGGGTIDITYMIVFHDQNDGAILVEIIDIDGLPNFGGDDVTDAIKTIFTDQILQEHTDILLDSMTNRNSMVAYEESIRENERRLWSYSNELKETLLLEDKAAFFDIELNSLDKVNGQIVKKIVRPNLTIHEVNQAYISRIEESVEIVKDIFLKDSETSDKKDLKRCILLNGRSSVLPIVNETFNKFKNTQSSVVNEISKNGDQFEEHPVTSDYLKYDDLIQSKDPKASVAKGAAIYKRSRLLGQRIEINGLEGKSWSRFGLQVAAVRLRTKFMEWISKNKLFIEKEKFDEYKKEDSDDFAVNQMPWKFCFDSDGELEVPIAVFENFGRDDLFLRDNCLCIGNYTLSKPQKCTRNEVEGELRMGVTKEYDLVLKAKIYGEWIDTRRVE